MIYADGRLLSSSIFPLVRLNNDLHGHAFRLQRVRERQRRVS